MSHVSARSVARQILFGALVAVLPVPATASPSLHTLSATAIDGKTVNLADFRGKVLMIVNTASKCGFTPQYEGLEKLYETYKDRGFVVLGFPSNDFGGQEPGTNEEVVRFCKMNYGVSFPLFQKAEVKGEKKQPVFKFLTEDQTEELQGEVRWNFEKFIISKDGSLRKRFRSMTKPTDESVTGAIEELLNEKM